MSVKTIPTGVHPAMNVVCVAGNSASCLQQHAKLLAVQEDRHQDAIAAAFAAYCRAAAASSVAACMVCMSLEHPSIS